MHRASLSIILLVTLFSNIITESSCYKILGFRQVLPTKAPTALRRHHRLTQLKDISFFSQIKVFSSSQSNEVSDSSRAVVPSICERVRTSIQLCTSGTLSTSCINKTTNGIDATLQSPVPFGSYLKFVVDECGWPVLMLNKNSIHAVNIKSNSRATLCLNPQSKGKNAEAGDSKAAAELDDIIASVTLVGDVLPLVGEELTMHKAAYAIVHLASDDMADSEMFEFYRLKPSQIYACDELECHAPKWIDASHYEQAKPNTLLLDMTKVIVRMNAEKQLDLKNLCSHRFQKDVAAVCGAGSTIVGVRIKSIDRDGMVVSLECSDSPAGKACGASTSACSSDYGIATGTGTGPLRRIEFKNKAISAEDAKSEMLKLFQAAWEATSSTGP